MVSTQIKKIEDFAKIILERTTPQAFLLWFFMLCIPNNYLIVIGDVTIDKYGMSFFALILIGLSFSEIIAKKKEAETQLQICQEKNQSLMLEIKLNDLYNDPQKIIEQKVEEKEKKS